ncbi:MAG: hypothetical protein WA580_00495 [Acidimicrobiales bacterium]
MISRCRQRTSRLVGTGARLLARVAISAALACTGTLGLLALGAHASSAVSPGDYLCAVGVTVQSALEGSAFTNLLEVEVSSTSCSSPTPDTTSTTVSFALVGTPSASATFSTAPITTASGFASVSAVANDNAGTYSVSATSPSSASSSSPSVTFSLTNVAPLSDTMTADVPSYQSAVVGADFTLPLAVSVQAANGNPASDVPVLFVAPTTGASGTFVGGASSFYGETDAQGVASAPAFYANDTSGGYAIEVYASGYAVPIAFAMTNEALAVMSVSSVTPTVLSRGSTRVVTISGSGFESGGTVDFSSPGVKVTSTTLVSPSEISADITVSKTARLGASSVTVTNPSGTSVTGTYAFTVAPLVTSAPEPLQLGFARDATGLSGAQERALRAFVREVAPDSSLDCTGYGANAALANQRALRVARYVQSLDPNAHIARRVVISASESKAVLDVR